MQNGAIIEGVLRACGIGAVATLLGYCGAAAFAAPRRAARRVAWGLAIACFVTPPLLVGYAYANFTGISCLPPGLREGVEDSSWPGNNLRAAGTRARLRLGTGGRPSIEAQSLCTRGSMSPRDQLRPEGGRIRRSARGCQDPQETKVAQRGRRRVPRWEALGQGAGLGFSLAVVARAPDLIDRLDIHLLGDRAIQGDWFL